ncbi:MAG: hypothetical protein GC154_14340 [bacterium]|nr:hypothetical protein [bacterium]
MSTKRPGRTDPGWLRIIGQASFIPVFLALYPIAFFFIGEWLGEQFGIPWLKVVFLLLGVFSGFRQSFFVIKKIQDQLEKMGGS